MNITVKVDITQVTNYLQGFARQSRFALVKALNKTANDAQRDIRTGIEKRFVLRRKDFILRSVKIPKEARADTRTNRYNVEIMIDPQRDVLAKFEKGGEKHPIDGRALAIPTTNVRKTITATIPLSRRPRGLFASKKKVVSKAGLLLESVGKGRAAVTRVLYVWRGRIRIKPMLEFEKTATTSVEKQWQPNAEESVRYEIANLKP